MLPTKGGKKRQIRARRSEARMEVDTNTESKVDGGDTNKHTENVQVSDESADAARKRARLATETEVAD